jgi:hypothetical protein
LEVRAVDVDHQLLRVSNLNFKFCQGRHKQIPSWDIFAGRFVFTFSSLSTPSGPISLQTTVYSHSKTVCDIRPLPQCGNTFIDISLLCDCSKEALDALLALGVALGGKLCDFAHTAAQSLPLQLLA